MKRTLLGLCLILLSGASTFAQSRNSFAIIVDSKSYEKCRTEIENYRESVCKDGLDAFITAADWQSPDQVKDSLVRFYSERNLEGAVFIGDIPIAMVRKGQHLTSAFKMDESFPMRESSVPSDRFYDDLDLKFRFIGRDTTQSNLFYYDLAPDSPQEISCDIYSGRIKPSSSYNNPYEELAAYLKKAVQAKEESNLLDKVSSYTGDGSFSNSLMAWKDESITLREQMPDAFAGKEEAKFFVFAMKPFMKETMLKEIQRPELDLVLFHEHGMPERQYLTGIPESYSADEYYERGKYYARSIIRTKMRYGKSFEEAKASFAEEYGTDPSWYEDALDPEVVRADSLFDLKTGIVLDDIQKAEPNVRMAIFDACYNGDFREEDCVANRYIMSDGKCVVGIGNSVNVLQDKSSSDLMGMLAAGYRAGEWMQQVNILESHVIGDPTFHFKSSYKMENPDLKNADPEYWLKYTSEDYPCDIRGLALHKLYKLEYEELSDLLIRTYQTSPYYMERLQCMHLLAHYDDGNYASLLEEALDDPYEFIRRKAVTFAGKVGTDKMAEALAKAYLNDINSKRVAFDIGFSSGHFANRKFEKALTEEVEKADFILDKDRFMEEAKKNYISGLNMTGYTEAAIESENSSDRKKMTYLSGMRNNPYPQFAEKLIGIVKDEAASEALRIKSAEVLGWYVRAWNKGMIRKELSDYLKTGKEIPTSLSEEVGKTILRLESYSR